MSRKITQKNQHDFFIEQHKMPNSKPKRVRPPKVTDSNFLQELEKYEVLCQWSPIPLFSGILVAITYSVPIEISIWFLLIIAAASLRTEWGRKED